MGCNHDVGVAGIWPLRHPAAFLEILQESGNHAVDSLWSKEGQQAVLRAKGIPDGVCRITFAAVDGVIECAVIPAIFREDSRIEQRMIERSVKQGFIGIGCSADLQSRKL